VVGGYGPLSGQFIAASFQGNTSFTDVQYACTLPLP
jgi:hypothetical protein